MTAAAAPPPTERPTSATAVRSPAAGTLVGLGFVALTSLFFGAAPTFARLAFDGGTGTLTLQFARFAFAGIGLWLVLAAIGKPIRIPRHHLPLLAILVVLSGGASYGYMTSVRYIPVPVASLVFFTFPLMVGPLAHLIGDERLTTHRVLALAVGFAGIVLVLEGGMGHADPWGLALAFGGGTCVAVSFQISRRLTVGIPATLLTATVASVSAVACGLLLAVHGELDLPTSTRGWVGVTGNAVAYTVGLSCLFEAIRRLGAVRTAIAGNLEPVISVALAAVVLDEALSGVQLAGAAVVLAGIALAQRRGRGRR